MSIERLAAAGESGMRVLTVAEVADVLRCSTTTVNRNLINTGRLQAVHIGQRKRVISVEELESFIRKRRITKLGGAA